MWHDRWSPRNLDDLARAGALIVAVTYALGMLVVTLHQGRYGVWPLEILKPRALAAGLLLVSTGLIGVFAAAKCFGLGGLTATSLANPLSMGVERMLRMSELVCACGSIGWTLGLGLFASDNDWPHPRALAAVGVALGSACHVVAARKGRLPSAWRIVLALTAVSIVLMSFWLWDQTTGSFVLWLCATGFLLISGTELFRDVMHGSPDAIGSKILIPVALLVYFTTAVYGHVVPRFGGGFSPAVTVLLEHDLPFAKSSVPLRLFLLDENDRGFYLLRSRTSAQAIWLPRGVAVSVIHDASPQDRQPHSDGVSPVSGHD